MGYQTNVEHSYDIFMLCFNLVFVPIWQHLVDSKSLDDGRHRKWISISTMIHRYAHWWSDYTKEYFLSCWELLFIKKIRLCWYNIASVYLITMHRLGCTPKLTPRVGLSLFIEAFAISDSCSVHAQAVFTYCFLRNREASTIISIHESARTWSIWEGLCNRTDFIGVVKIGRNLARVVSVISHTEGSCDRPPFWWEEWHKVRPQDTLWRCLIMSRWSRHRVTFIDCLSPSFQSFPFPLLIPREWMAMIIAALSAQAIIRLLTNVFLS